jgi:Leucine-rich repeat (LRR) protein
MGDANSPALVFDGHRAWPSQVALPVPHGRQALTCVWIKNNQLASAKTIYNVRMRIEYFHDGVPEFTVNSAQWWYVVPGRAVQSVSYIDLEANESQCVAVYMKPVGPTTLSPPWPQSAPDENGGTRPLRLGRWKMRMIVTADGIAPLVGEIEFTILQEAGEERLSIAAMPPLGDFRLPLLPIQHKATGHIRSIWDWIGRKWKWAALATAGVGVGRAGEYAVGCGLFVLSTLAAVSQISQWKKAHPSGQRSIKVLGYLTVAAAFVFSIVVTAIVKGNDPWSHLPAAWSKLLKPQESTSVAASNQASAPKLIVTAPSPAATSQPSTESAVEGLTRLGWVVIADSENGTRIQFQDRSKPLPDMRESAKYIRLLRGHLSVGIIEALSLHGLSNLGSIKNIESLTLAGAFNDLADLRTMKLIQRLVLVGLSVGDLRSVGSLVQLKELTLEQRPNRMLDITPLSTLVNLQRLTIVQFPIQGLSALRSMNSLSTLNLTGSVVADLAPLHDLTTLRELTIDQRMVPGLAALTGGNLKTLHVTHSDGIADPIDLTPIAGLASLEFLDITAAGSINLAPLRKLSGLSKLIVTGTTVSFRDFNYTIHLQDPNAISDLHNVKMLGLAWIDVQNTDFLRGLDGLEEIYINQTRSLSDIRTLGTLKSLRSVQLAATNVVDISPLLDLPNLRTLTLQVTPARLDVVTELKRQGVTIK